MKRIVLFFAILLVPFMLFSAEFVAFSNNWGTHPLFNLASQTSSGVELVFSMHEMVIEEQEIEGQLMESYGVPAVFLPRPGAPNLGGACRYVAIPEGSRAVVEILGSRTEVYSGIEVAPASNIPVELDDSPLKYEKDMEIYGANAYWPSSPVKLSEVRQIRGVDVVKVGVIPFQYNPVTKELVVYKDIRFRIRFIGGTGHFGEDRLRSRFWDPLLQGHLINYTSLPEMDYYSAERTPNRDNVEYIIVVPDDAVFEAWGDTICAWRKLQGISSEVFTLTEVGGNTWQDIKSFLQNAYNTWNPAPVAFLLLSDYPNSGMDVYGIDTRVLTHPYGYAAYASDNVLADFDGDTLPEMYHGRICAQDNSDLDIMVNKFLSYERNPYTAANFYNEPLMACGWQTERWFQMCVEVCRGFFEYTEGKTPETQYNIYSGSPTQNGPWSSRQGTAPVVAYWNSFGYIPLTNPYPASYWNNGSAAGINAAINSGAFFLQHRDHGSETGWGEPDYDINDINNLTNDKFVYVNSTNCLTGRYHWSSECFVERFHRIQYGALGVNGASSVSMSFANDTYIWGMFDSYWPHFDPGYPIADMAGYPNLRSAPAMTSGKYYHEAMWFPDSAGAGGYRDLTHGLFHHFGDAFMTLYSEVPTNLTVNHSGVLYVGVTTFPVAADDSSIIALTVNGEIIGVAEGTGGTVDISIPPQNPGTMKVTVTKWNHYRYEADVNIVPGSGPYCGYLKSNVDDSGGNGDGLINPGETIDWEIWVKNFGNADAYGVYGLLDESDPYITLSVDSCWYGNIVSGDSTAGTNPFTFSVANDCPDGYTADFSFDVHDVNDSVWSSNPSITVYAPVLTLDGYVVDPGGDQRLDPGETADLVVTLMNGGGGHAYSVTGFLYESNAYITVTDPDGSFGDIMAGTSGDNTSDPFSVQAAGNTPTGETVTFYLEVTSGVYCDTLSFSLTVGAKHYFVWDPDPDHSSGPAIDVALQACGFVGDYNYSLPVTALDEYLAVFVCVGIYSNNFVIDAGSAEATALVNFVNAGGRMYLEGGDVWYWDPPYNNGYDFGPLFGINADDDGTDDLATVQGQGGTFTVGMSFTYNGENNYIDHINPTGSGFLIFRNSSPSYNCGVANDAGSYRTVGTSWEFSGLVDGSPPSTKAALADSIMHFFGIFVGVEEEVVGMSLPKVYGLSQSYPNPCGSHAFIKYQVPRKSSVDLRVYDASGRLVEVVVDGEVAAGYHSTRLDTKSYVSGVYFYRLASGNKVFTKKLIVVR